MRKEEFFKSLSFRFEKQVSEIEKKSEKETFEKMVKYFFKCVLAPVEVNIF